MINRQLSGRERERESCNKCFVARKKRYCLPCSATAEENDRRKCKKPREETVGGDQKLRYLV